MNNECYLSEVFSAIQGEGPLIGVRQLFIRFSICDLRCTWCDTPDSLTKNESCTIEKESGIREFLEVKNPLSISNLLFYIEPLFKTKHHSISLTGGEPLIHHNFLKELLPILKKDFSIPIYLETGGHRPHELNNIIESLDYISMDFKLPSSANTGILWDRHREFLEVSKKAKNLKGIWVKIVITKQTLGEELTKSINLIKSVFKNHELEVFLQPVTEINNIKPPEELELLNIQKNLLNIYPKIRVVPQTHKLIGQK